MNPNFAESTSSAKLPHRTFRLKTKALKYGILSTILLIAVLVRSYLILIRGGFYEDQVEWAVANNYLGVLTKIYISMRDVILSPIFEKYIYAYPPGYPTFLAIFKSTITENLIAIRFIQSFLDVIAILPLIYIANITSRSYVFAFVACGIYAASPWWAAGSTYLLAESLLPALFIILIAALVAIREHPEKLLSWIVLGLLAAVLPFFRSEMVLLFIPLAVWAILVTPARQRLRSAACVVLAFAAPLSAWVIRNYLIHGSFLLTPPVKWYAAWSGLGQVPNDYGYETSDYLAGIFLKSKGITQHTAQSEAHFKAEYMSAWLEHPAHVLETIIFRFKLILTAIDLSIANPKIVDLAYYLFWVMLCSTPIALIWLVSKRRWSDAFLVALPAGYAVCSLGLLYVEQRYVRYASLSYLIAFPIFLAAVTEVPSHVLNKWGATQARISMTVVATLAVGALAAYSINFLPALRQMAVEAAYANMREPHSMEILPWTGTLDDFTLHKSIPDVDVSKSADGLELSFTAKSGSYLLAAPMHNGPGDFVHIKYKIVLKEGGLGIGVLSKDKARWLSFRLLSGAPGTAREGSFYMKAEDESSLIITSEKSEGSYRAVFKDLRWKIACPQGGTPEPLLLIFNKDFALTGPCLQNQVE